MEGATMSRTDVHLPWHVKEQDPYWKTQDNVRNYHCGCRLCTGHYDRIWNRRRERAAQRAVLTELVKLVQDGWDVDYTIPAAHKWSSFKSRYGLNVLGKGPDGTRNNGADDPLDHPGTDSP